MILTQGGITREKAARVFEDMVVVTKKIRPGDGWTDGTFPRSLVPDGIEVMQDRMSNDGKHLSETQKLFQVEDRIEDMNEARVEVLVRKAIGQVWSWGYTHLYEIRFKQMTVKVGDPPEDFTMTAVVAVGLCIRSV